MSPFSSHGILALLFLLGNTLSPREYCVSQKPEDKVINSICVNTANDTQEFFSIAQMGLRSVVSWTVQKTHQEVNSGNVEDPTISTSTMELHAIKLDDGRFLAGWIFAKIRIPDGLFQFFYAQMEDQDGTAIGEFVNKRLCKGSDPAKKPDFPDFFFTPCSQVGAAATRPTSTLMFSWYKHIYNSAMKEKAKMYYSSLGQQKEITLIWRFSQTACDRPKQIRMRIYVRTSVENHGTHRSSWIEPNWFGIADILHPGDVLECQGSKLYPGVSGDLVPWIDKIGPIPNTNLGNSEIGKDIIRTKPFCKPVESKAGNDYKTTPSFGGRCKEHDKLTPSNETFHDCSAGMTVPANFTKHSEYLEKRKSCIKVNSCPCQCRPTIDAYKVGKDAPFCPGYKKFTPVTAKKDLTVIEFVGYGTNSTAGKSIMKGRKAHGVAMLLVSMCFVPISIMLSRYYKETWLPRPTSRLSRFGIRVLGLITILVFAFITVIGSIRPKTNSPFRKIVLFTHAFLGFVYYFLGIATIITSSWIPGSPSADDTECIDSPKFMSNSNLTLMPIAVAWVVIDLLFHILLTGLQFVMDKGADYKRPMYFPLLPILKGGEEKSTRGSMLRSLLLIIYGVVNGALTLTLIGKMFSVTQAGCGFGPTSCTHFDIDTPYDKDICDI
ncbi:hypothetical protein Ocin01_10148 [Orchesella cincta]|uniref:Ferric-chelate reductase 1 n=1 Tax=Orchesella cincta TaxID=48709 RepID=A0A1D2MU11_ORCCI|nr:hypothetical protein Ocin01_10148 [Orchesella cincta]